MSEICECGPYVFCMFIFLVFWVAFAFMVFFVQVQVLLPDDGSIRAETCSKNNKV
jgi:hypothetical protein